eukprot:gnl/TRDRNA2_/TRDRNA2_130430_c0_seq1.p2 gnl/TRDRNA2_/TRDRNA2_130430_c0~~gnl/TRDRNA2_/TRDRNA2_130430_c0_seq1.p2  ORF type:complete len:151 (-),score=25.21 gnl/TRDRNA2_/TRDRNA2_130430_c0_seq1:176-628(-)
MPSHYPLISLAVVAQILLTVASCIRGDTEDRAHESAAWVERQLRPSERHHTVLDRTALDKGLRTGACCGCRARDWHSLLISTDSARRLSKRKRKDKKKTKSDGRRRHKKIEQQLVEQQLVQQRQQTAKKWKTCGTSTSTSTTASSCPIQT